MLILIGGLAEMNLMKDRVFLDTNIIVYSFLKEEIKASISRNLIKNPNSTISYQVIQEFCNVALKSFKVNLSLEKCKEYINKFLFPICIVYPNNELYNLALDIKFETNYSYYDCLILASAYMSECKIVYSEDMQHNFKVRNMTIINPYLF